MWARIIELMLASWLAVSRFIFNEPFSFWTVNELICAALIALFSLCSFHPKLEKIYLCHYAIVFWFFYLTFSHGAPLPPYLQNYQVLALLVLMTAIIPSHSHLPPRPWQRFLLRKGK